MYQTDPPHSPKEVLATMYALPCEDPAEADLLNSVTFIAKSLVRRNFSSAKLP